MFTFSHLPRLAEKNYQNGFPLGGGDCHLPPVLAWLMAPASVVFVDAGV